MSAFDLKIHGENPLAEQSLVKTYKQIKEQWTSFTPVENSLKFATFRHLATYAASYYTYALCRVLSSSAWSRFENQPFNLSEGRNYIKNVLNRGGLLEPFELNQFLFGKTSKNKENLANGLDFSHYLKRFQNK